jgi:hypothetical protein
MTHPASCTLDQARAAKPRVMAVFEKLAAVAGVGVTRVGGGYGVKVNLQTRPAEGTKLPDAVDGVPVRVEVVGSIRKLGGQEA